MGAWHAEQKTWIRQTGWNQLMDYTFCERLRSNDRPIAPVDRMASTEGSGTLRVMLTWKLPLGASDAPSHS